MTSDWCGYKRASSLRCEECDGYNEGVLYCSKGTGTLLAACSLACLLACTTEDRKFDVSLYVQVVVKKSSKPTISCVVVGKDERVASERTHRQVQKFKFTLCSA